MTYYIIDREGKVYKGKADRYRDGMIPYGSKLYNPYTKQTVIGWKNYCSIMSKYQKR